MGSCKAEQYAVARPFKEKLMLQLNDVHAGYGEKLVLNGVTLNVGENEIVGLVGPNGSGKSTVLKSTFGLLKLSKGSVSYNGLDIHNRGAAANVKSGICYVPQGSKVFPHLTVQENMEMGGVLLDDSRELQARIEQMYEKFPKLKEYRNKPAAKLSGGERQMVGFCVGLIMNPKLLLVDEPSIGLAPQLVAQTMELIRNCRDEFNTSVLIVEQNVRSMLTIADRVYLLKTGKIVYNESRVDVGTEQRLRELFLT